MARIQRHDEILKIVSLRKRVTVQELTERLSVSEVTIRKDLTILEEMGYLARTRGGAMLAEDREHLRTIGARRRENVERKETIARKARELVADGDTIFIDSGSTCRLFARGLRDMNLRIVTNSIDVMVELADAPGIALFSLGGSYRKDAGSFIGPIAIETLRNFQIETCFLGTTGFSADGAFASRNTIEAQLKRQVISVSSRKVVLVDSGKYQTTAFCVFARREDIDVLVTDDGFRETARMRELGLEPLLAETETASGADGVQPSMRTVPGTGYADMTDTEI